MREFREGDIFIWCWKPEVEHAKGGYIQAYHCKSRIAIFEGGVLVDTFWGGSGNDIALQLDRIEVTWLGNANDMQPIPDWQMKYYSPSDIVDTRHSNRTSAPIYLKPGAKRNAEVMEEYARREIDTAIREGQQAQRKMGRMFEALNRIEAGELDKVEL